MSHFQPQPRPSTAALLAQIADADEVLDWAAAHPAETCSLAKHTLGITRSIRDYAAADLAARELMDRITAGTSS